MKITITKLRTFPGMEDEAFDCVLLADGVPFAHAHYGGTGGPTDVEYSKFGGTFREPGPKGREVLAWIATLPEVPYGHGMDGTFKPDIEYIAAEAVSEEQEARRVRRWIKGGKTVVLKPDGEYLISNRPYAPDHKAALLAGQPEGTKILNEDPRFADALPGEADLKRKEDQRRRKICRTSTLVEMPDGSLRVYKGYPYNEATKARMDDVVARKLPGGVILNPRYS